VHCNIYFVYIFKEVVGVVVLETKKKRVMISLTEEQNSELEKLAKTKGFSKSAIVVVALEEYKKGQKNA